MKQDQHLTTDGLMHSTHRNQRMHVHLAINPTCTYRMIEHEWWRVMVDHTSFETRCWLSLFTNLDHGFRLCLLIRTGIHKLLITTECLTTPGKPSTKQQGSQLQSSRDTGLKLALFNIMNTRRCTPHIHWILTTILDPFQDFQESASYTERTVTQDMKA